MKMKAAVYERYGPPEVVQIKEVEQPIPKDNEILVRIYATSVRTGDWRMRKADPFLARIYNGLVRPKRRILGFELSGVVETIGKAVNQFKTGDQVFASAGLEFGAHAEYICLPENGIVTLKPDTLSHLEAAAIPSGALAALPLIRDRGNLEQGQRVLIYGASGSVGTYAIQFARYYGAQVTGVCSAGNLGLVRSLGAENVIDYTQGDFISKEREYDLIFDGVGKMISGISKSQFESMLGSHGRFVSIDDNYRESKENLQFIRELVEKGEVKPVIDRCYPLEQIAEAHRYVELGHKKGNVVISVQSEEP